MNFLCTVAITSVESLTRNAVVFDSPSSFLMYSFVKFSMNTLRATSVPHLHRITSEEKDILIADIVSGLTTHRPSMVQVAYEMLCTSIAALEEDTADMVAHLSDFADQCGVILARSRVALGNQS